ncbi:putative secondary metabolism biosynthetic enzyme [Microsporum ferrugineum]
MLFLSPRNNLEGHLNVLEGVDCQVFLKAEGTRVDHILHKRPMQTSVVPELEELLHESPVEIYPYAKSFEEARMDPCLVLHTTGSTGLPKPITWKVGILSTYEAWRTIPPVNGYVPPTEIYQQARRAYTSMPLFHTSGLNAGITWALLLGVTLVYGGPHVVPNAAYTDDMHKFAGVDASMGAPSIYEDLSRNPTSLERINKLHYVIASGAPLSRKAGELISKHTRVISNLGATETACLQRLAPAIDDWAYFYWHPTHSGIEMREAVEGLYELFLVRDPKLELYQGVFNTFPELPEWSMNDLYSRHPDPAKGFLYRYEGRKDDIIVLSNGEKVSPALMEATLMSDPLVKGAMVVGKGKFQPAALIDLAQPPSEDSSQRRQLVEDLLPAISDANEHAPGHGKLDQYHILFANPNKPIQYLGQGKIQRHRTYKLYEDEIEALYKAADNANGQFGLCNLPSPSFTSKQSVTRWLRQLVIEITSIKDLDLDQDFFKAGMDSLQVIRMARELKFQAKEANLRQHDGEEFSPAAIYSRPTLNQLSAFILRQTGVKLSTNGLVNGDADSHTNGHFKADIDSHINGHINGHVKGKIDGHILGGISGYIKGHFDGHIDGRMTGHIVGHVDMRYESHNHTLKNGHSKHRSNGDVNGFSSLSANHYVDGILGSSTSQNMQVLLHKYTKDLPHPTEDAPLAAPENMVILLTGSTGSLGSYLLDTLYNDKSVSHIICLNRTSDAGKKHLQTGLTRGLSTLYGDRVEFFKADLANTQLGLPTSIYNRLLKTVTHVIHTQWPVNFNWPLASFEPYICGVRNLIDFSFTSKHKSFILFVSSVSAVGSWEDVDSVPEEPVHNLNMASTMGYGQSKLISECILDRAARVSGVRSACCRIGIIAGPVERKLGMWNRHEYIPSIVISSAHLKTFPGMFPSRDRVDWLPVDKLATILVEILTFSCASQQESSQSRMLTYNVVNPHVVPWSKFASWAISLYSKETKMRTCSFPEWTEALGQTSNEPVDPERNPAIKLLDFYREAGGLKKRPRMLACDKAARASKTLREVGAVNETWVRKPGISTGVSSVHHASQNSGSKCSTPELLRDIASDRADKIRLTRIYRGHNEREAYIYIGCSQPPRHLYPQPIESPTLQPLEQVPYKMTTFRQAAFKEAGGPLVIEEVEMTSPGRGEVLVKVQACGVCFSDTFAQHNVMGGGLCGVAAELIASSPIVPGHEIIGHVTAVGEGVEQWKIGDRIGGAWHGGHDGTCAQCRKGYFQMCDNQVVNGETKGGGYAEYCTLRAEAGVRIPKHVDAAKYAPILCAGMTMFNSIRHMNIPVGSTVAIQGLGGLGHLAIQYARSFGYRVVALSRNAEKEAFARELGAHEYIDASKCDVGEQLQKLGGVSLIVSTAPTKDAIEPLLKGLGMLGKLLILSVPGDITVNTGVMLRYGISVQSWPCGHATDSEEAIAFTELEGINCMIEKFPLEKANDALEAMVKGTVRFRAVITME